MGLLDDAIREHLELKRQHGAAADEVQRQEHEALGPVRRRGDPEPEPPEEPLATSDDSHGPALADHDASYGDPAQAAIPLDQPVMPEPTGHEALPGEFAPGEEPAAVPSSRPIEDTRPAAVPVRGPEPEPEPEPETVERGRGFAGDELWLDDSDDPVPPGDGGESAGQETSAFSAADVADATGEPVAPNEDVLEETPEFLQETPEHERLWFEQRPPRGFDFDQ